jgi:hypothetical protein
MTGEGPSTAAGTVSGDQPAAPTSTATTRRQALLLIHGIGEQSPMETLRGFAEAVWKSATGLHTPPTPRGGDPADLFFVPDPRSESRELRKISTRKGRSRIAESGDGHPDSVRTDFFEIYWTDATKDSKWSDFMGWYWRLLLRRRRDAPPDVRGIWYGLWIITIVLVLISATIILWFPLELDEARADPRSLDAAFDILMLGAAIAAAGFFARPFSGTRLWPSNWALFGGLGLAGFVGIFLAAYLIRWVTKGFVSHHWAYTAAGLAIAVVFSVGLATPGQVLRRCRAILPRRARQYRRP